MSFGELKQTYVLFTSCLLFRIISTSAPHHSWNITNNPKVALRLRKSTRHLFPLLQCLLCDQTCLCCIRLWMKMMHQAVRKMHKNSYPQIHKVNNQPKMNTNS